MVDRPPGDPQANPPNTTPPPPRTFFSSTSANDFFERFRTMLDEQHAQTLQATLQAQEAFVQQINAPIVAFTANIERFLNAIQPPPPPRRSPASTPERETLLSPSQRPTPSFTEEAEDIPVHPYRSHPPPRPTPQTAPRPLPVREMTAFTTTTGEQPVNHSGGRLQVSKFPNFMVRIVKMSWLGYI